MAASIEVIHNKINKKIFILREMIKSLEEKCEQKKIGHLELGVINSNLQAIKTSYDINTLLFINEFYAGNFDKNNNGEYRKSLIIHGILDSLDRILSDLEKFVNKFRNKLRSIAISKFIQEYRNIQIITVIPEEASWVCQVCDNPLTISYDETAVLCGKCGFTDDLVANLY